MGPVAPPSWKSVPDGPTLELAMVLLDRVTALKDARLTGHMVLRVFLLRRVLPLKASSALMWEYIGPGDQSALADGHLPKEHLARLAWMVLGSMLGEPPDDGGPPPFSVFERRPDDLPFLGAISAPPSVEVWDEKEGSCDSPLSVGTTSLCPSQGETSFAWAFGKRPCPGCFRTSAPLWKRHYALKLSGR